MGRAERVEEGKLKIVADFQRIFDLSKVGDSGRCHLHPVAICIQSPLLFLLISSPDLLSLYGPSDKFAGMQLNSLVHLLTNRSAD